MKFILHKLFCYLFCFATFTTAINILASDSSGVCSAISDNITPSISCCFPEDYSITNNSNVYGQTNFVTHPVQWDQFRRMSGVSTEKLHLFNQTEFYGTVSLALQYQQTSNANHLAQWFLFNNNSPNSMSYAPNDNGTGEIFSADINAYNFGVTATGTISFQPKIQNFIADIDLYMGWDQFVCGLWSRVSIPINWTRWDLQLCDSNQSDPGNDTFPIALMQKGEAAEVTYANLQQAWVGNKPFGDAPVMLSGCIDGPKDVTAVAGLKLELGYDFVRKTDRHLALSCLVVVPTGNSPNAQYLFEPISGSNKQWELGVDINGHYNFWEAAECYRSLGLHFDVAIMGMLKRNQKRIFGLKAGPDGTCSAGATWLLLKEFDNGDEYARLQRASNILALNADIGSSFETNLGILVKYIHNHFSFDLGYELYYRNSESISNRIPIEEDKYSIKGNTNAGIDTTASKSTISINGATDVELIHLKDTDVCECPALQPAYLSSKLFSFIEHSWDSNWQPTFSIGCAYEWGNKRDGANNLAANQWSVLAKGSVSF
jgi:hypothetical protein